MEIPGDASRAALAALIRGRIRGLPFRKTDALTDVFDE
jgi:hypothetical protein